jgi:hypothetical protein
MAESMGSEEGSTRPVRLRHHHKIPDGITREHILEALKEIDLAGWDKKNNSIKYDLVFEGKRYPPKIVVKYAHKHAFGTPLDVSEFSGGEDSTNRFFRAWGFTIVLKDPDETAIIPVQTFTDLDKKITFVEELPPELQPEVRDTEHRIYLGKKTDHFSENQKRTALGDAGELAVIEIEKALLHNAGKDYLISRIEHVAKTQGDGLGFDIQSITPNGQDKLIEVKTTSEGIFTPFILTDTEFARSRKDPNCFYLYRLYDFHPGKNLVKFYILNGDLTNQTSRQPLQYQCIPIGHNTIETDRNLYS